MFIASLSKERKNLFTIRATPSFMYSTIKFLKRTQTQQLPIQQLSNFPNSGNSARERVIAFGAYFTLSGVYFLMRKKNKKK